MPLLCCCLATAANICCAFCPACYTQRCVRPALPASACELVRAPYLPPQTMIAVGFSTRQARPPQRDTAGERVLRDALGSTLYSGTSEMQRIIIARFLGL
ncbi:MAG: acyl-CoA dehydrogenase family protein [Gemmatimonadaceae bacterium]